MSLLQRGLMFVLAAGTLAIPSSVPPENRAGGRAAVPIDPQTVSLYSPQEKEYYLAQDQLDFIRPGLNVSVLNVSNMAPGQSPVVEISMTDALGQPLDRTGGLTPGKIDAQFIVAQWNDAAAEYVNMTMLNIGTATLPLHDVGGKWTDVAVGDSKYAFGMKLPANFDVTKTTVLGIYAGRAMKDYLGKDFNAPALKVFRPDGGTIGPVFAEMDTPKCNKCHDPLSMHGGFGPPIQDLKLCVLCHTSQMPPTAKGEALDFKVLVHKIHSSQSDAVGEITYPQAYLNNCVACHDPKAAQGTVYLTRPARAACGGCHTTVNFATGEGHSTGKIVQIDDSKCASCHQPDSGKEYDASIKGAHTLDNASTQLKGLNATILSIDKTAPGQNPVVTFKLTETAGNVLDPKPFGSNVNVLVAGPTADYANWPNVRERADGATFNGTTAVYTMKWKVPDNFTGSLAFSMDVRRTVVLNAGLPNAKNFNECAFNQIVYAASTGTATPRRTIIAQDKCLSCHGFLGLHGGQRQNVLYCSMCHNPNADDSPYRTAGTPESVDFRRMIHRIHSGENLAQDFTIIAYRGTVVNYNDVTYPGDRRNCTTCHASQATANIPVVPGALNVVTKRDYFTPQGPATAACLGCHDTRDAEAHAYLNTAVFGEACGACHGAGSEWAVTKVHAR